MQTLLLLWDDSATSRLIKYSVEYAIESDTLSIFDVRPLEVSLLDLRWRTVAKRMQVRSNKSFDLLRSRFLESNKLGPLIEEIARRHDLSIITPKVDCR